MSLNLARQSISTAGSTLLLRAAESAAEAIGVAVAVAVVDESGVAKGFSRMDGAPLVSCDIARDKAVAAASFGLATHLWYERIKDQPELLHGLNKAAGFTMLGGGVPIVLAGEVIGGLGVSGATAEQDLALAEAALHALQQAFASPA